MTFYQPFIRSRIKVLEDDLYMNLNGQVQVGKYRKGALNVFKGINSEQEAEKYKSQESMKATCYVVNIDGGHAVLTKKLHDLFIKTKSYIDENLDPLKNINHYDVAELCAAISLLEDSCNGLMQVPIDRDKIYKKAVQALTIIKQITNDVWNEADLELMESRINDDSKA